MLTCSESSGDLEVSLPCLRCGAVADSSQIKILRRQGGNRLLAFAPANDLSVISRSSEFVDGQYSRSMIDGRERKREVDLQGGKVLGDEWADHVVKNRNGIILRAS